MSSTFRGIEISKSSLFASRDALDVTGHNIANAGTAGYTRQIVNFTNVPALDMFSPSSRVGAGVNIESISRSRDAFLDGQYRARNQEANYADTLQSNYSQIENIINEPSDTGLISAFQDFETSLKQDLANKPSDPAVRGEVRERAQTLVDRFHLMSQQLTSMQANLGEQINAKVTESNGYLNNIAALQSQIDQIEATPGAPVPNDLLDQRDALLDQLSGNLNITVTRGSNDSITITTGSNVLFDGKTVTQVTTDTASGGQIGAMLDMQNTIVPGYQAQLDRTAAQLVASFNQQHQQGYNYIVGSQPTNGINFFDPSKTTAATIQLDSMITDDTKGGVWNIAASSNGDAGDGTNAIALGNVLGTGNSSPMVIYRSLVGQVGVDSQQSQVADDNAKVLVKQASSQRDSVTGVSLDEESSNMIKFQYQYQAAAKIMNTLDSVLDTLINKMI